VATSFGTIRVLEVDPLADPRWPELVDRHPSATIFHSRAWLEALRRAYGYQPVVYTTSPEGTALTNGIVCCRIQSWLTGRRLVSLPFSDHAEPLTEDEDTLQALLQGLAAGLGRHGYRYLELRPVRPCPVGAAGFAESATFYFHRLDLSPPLTTIFDHLHKDCIRRKIRRAERDAVVVEDGRSPALLRDFYRLLVLASRRRQLPPQPLGWFRHLIDCVGEGLKLRVAYRSGQPLAGILTLRFKDTMIYKYGASDPRFNRLGGTPLLLWRAIEEAKALGLREMDLGRSDRHPPGLAAFKDRWGATRSVLRYARWPVSSVAAVDPWRLRVAKRCFARMPDAVRVLAGRLLYRHAA
jgi:CelD/BcsL family acetyltransferase involved in cellulose biosynthesis